MLAATLDSVVAPVVVVVAPLDTVAAPSLAIVTTAIVDGDDHTTVPTARDTQVVTILVLHCYCY